MTDTELVIFDCDGVLIGSETLAIELDLEMLHELGWALSRDEVIERFMGRSPTYQRGEIERWLGGPLPADWTTRWETEFRRKLAAELRAIPGIVDALDEITLKTCVASSSDHAHLEYALGLVGLYERFAGRIFSASEVEHGKPAPDLFLHAANLMGVAPERCVVVEDSRYGVQAARAAGMPVFAYAGGAMTPVDVLNGPGTTVFYDMRELPALLADMAHPE
jgi:HAD superfamily hydrolase (TIGR01509 family)